MCTMTLMDPLDARIALALDDDPDATILALAQTLGVARNTVHARLRRMAADGALKPFEAGASIPPPSGTAWWRSCRSR